LSEARLRPSLRRALLDPIVIAALLGLVGGAVTGLIGTGRNNAFERNEKRCERAYAFLQDESVNTRLQGDEEFFRVQRAIALECTTERAKP
jgi:hypothetical protein